MRTLVIAAIVLAPAVLIAVLRNEARRGRARVEASTVRVDTNGARRELVDGRVEEILWSEVRVVEVMRASSGPHRRSGGVVLLGGDGERGCLVPLDRLEQSRLTTHLRQSLPGFDVRRLDEAIAKRPPARTVIWGDPDAPEHGGDH